MRSRDRGRLNRSRAFDGSTILREDRDLREEPVDPETLAAFLDGTIDEGGRRWVLDRVAHDVAWYEALIEADALKTAVGGEEAERADVASIGDLPVDRLRPRPPRANRWRLLTTVGAPLALAAGIATVWVLSEGGPLRSTRAPVSVVASLAEGLPATGSEAIFGPDWTTPVWSATRGQAEGLSIHGRAFRLGVHWADLALGFAVGDSTATSDVAAALALLAGTSAGEPLARRVETLARAGPRAQPAEARAVVEAIRRTSGAPDWFDLGLWSETARLATLAGRVDFFAEGDRPMREFARLTSTVDRPSAGARSALDDLARVLNEGRPSPTTLSRLRSVLDTLIQAASQ